MNWKLHCRFWWGTWSALIIWWVSLVALELIRERTFIDPSLGALTLPLTLLQLAQIPVGGFVSGLICSFLWHPVAKRVTCEQWGAIVVLLFFAPILLLRPMPLSPFIVPVIVAFPCALVPFHRGINVGFRYWREGRWRNFVGLANDWERDKNQR